MIRFLVFSFFFFNDPPTTEIYTLSLHDALPISYKRRRRPPAPGSSSAPRRWRRRRPRGAELEDRKSTRLNSSHDQISYAVFCLKKKKKNITLTPPLHQQPTSTTKYTTSTQDSTI